MVRVVIALIAVGILAATATYAYGETYQTAGDDTVISGETWTPTAGSVTTLDESNRDGVFYNDTVVVRDQNGNLSRAGTDYEWYAGNGTVKALAGGNLDGDTSASISYRFEEPSRDAERSLAVLSQLPRMMGLALPLATVFVLLLFVRGA